MDVRHSEPLNSLLAIIGAAILGTSINMGYGAAALGDIAILLALFTFDNAEHRSGGQSIGFAGAAAFCLLTPFQTVAAALSPSAAAERSSYAAAAVWFIATSLLFAVDRFRMSSRETVSLGSAVLSSGHLAMQEAAVKPPVLEPSTHAAPVPLVKSGSTNSVANANIEPAREQLREQSPTLSPISAPVSPSPVPSPDVTHIPPGREAEIYLNLVGEGLNVLRTVRAENLGRDYYRIADIMPEGERWEFTPGQVVRCRKKSLSNGKHMVAYEEAPRAQ